MISSVLSTFLIHHNKSSDLKEKNCYLCSAKAAVAGGESPHEESRDSTEHRTS